MQDTEVVKIDVDMQSTCSICLQELTAPYFLRCTHGFHRGCIFEWLAHENTCPLCRAEVPCIEPEEPEESEEPEEPEEPEESEESENNDLDDDEQPESVPNHGLAGLVALGMMDDALTTGPTTYFHVPYHHYTNFTVTLIHPA